METFPAIGKRYAIKSVTLMLRNWGRGLLAVSDITTSNVEQLDKKKHAIFAHVETAFKSIKNTFKINVNRELAYHFIQKLNFSPKNYLFYE